jgi:hypothetical protein
LGFICDIMVRPETKLISRSSPSSSKNLLFSDDESDGDSSCSIILQHCATQQEMLTALLDIVAGINSGWESGFYNTSDIGRKGRL